MPVTGCADGSILTLQPFLCTNEANLEWHVTGDSAVTLPSNAQYSMPAQPLLLACSIPPLFVAYMNCTTLKGPFEDLQKESMASRGKV